MQDSLLSDSELPNLFYLHTSAGLIYLGWPPNKGRHPQECFGLATGALDLALSPSAFATALLAHGLVSIGS